MLSESHLGLGSHEYIRAAAMLERGRKIRSLRKLRSMGPPIMRELFRRRNQPNIVSMIFPALAYTQGLLERGAYEPVQTYRRSFLSSLRWRFGLFLGYWSARWYVFYVGRTLRRPPLDKRPGWNDYYMVLWFMTGNPAYTRILYDRANSVPAPGASEIERMVPFTCRWMLKSVRSQHADFDEQLRALEVEYGPVISPAVEDLGIDASLLPPDCEFTG